MSIDEQTSTQPGATGRSRWTWLIWLAVIGLISLIAWGLVNNTEIKPQIGDPAPPFELPLFSGYELEGKDSIALADLNGRVVVVNFWASWCVTCIYETDDLETTWNKYREDGVVVLGVAYLDEERKSREFMEKYGLTYPSGPDLRSQITSETYFVSQVPETFVIAPDGTVADVIIGEVTAERLATVIEPLLVE